MMLQPENEFTEYIEKLTDTLMKYFLHIILTGLFGLFLAACGSRSNSKSTDLFINEEHTRSIEISQPEQNLDLLTMQELRLLRDLAFTELGGDSLLDRIDLRIEQLKKENFIYIEDDTIANILNIVNLYQFREITRQELMDDLAMFNFVAAPDTLLQLFQVYQRNDLLEIPNFVTTDLMAQLSHIYENYVLRTVEERFFAPMLTELCLTLHDASVEQANRAAQENVKDMAAYNAAYFAVAYHLLTGKSLRIPGSYQSIVEEELAYIDQLENRRPALLDKRTNFDYSIFKPSGHYTRTTLLRRYYKAWKWLQLAPFCGDNTTQKQQAVLLALALHTAKTKNGVSVLEVYSNLNGAMNWFTGMPTNISILDLANLLKKERITNVTAALDAKFLNKLNAMIVNTAQRNQSVVKYPVTCRNGIYFFPQPANADVAANMDASSYLKRLDCIQALQYQTQHHPVFTQKLPWQRQNLETSSAFRVKMNHDLFIYGVVPDHPEPLPIPSPTDTLPEPIRLGYVEPALPFWTKLREWVELTDKTLNDHQLTTDTLIAFTKRLHRYITILEDAALKQLNHESLSDEAYRFMAHIGDSIEQFTISMIEPEIDRWDWATGTDKSISIIEKQPTAISSDSVIYKAIGDVNAIYVVVEIDGFLYLTKGAKFSYHEIFMPQEIDLKDEDWKEIRKNMYQHQEWITTPQ